MHKFTFQHNTKKAAQTMDQEDPLKKFRQEFVFPQTRQGENVLYFAGHSLGLMPVRSRQYINEELDAWGIHGVEGHFEARHPWLPYHENLTESFARLIGARAHEVVAMNTLTVNLHLMMVSFYRPTKTRYKILIENNTFPSDQYAVASQARFHGHDPKEAIIELKPKPGKITVEPQDILETIETNKDSLALVMLGNVNYLSGQYFNIPAITKKAHDVGALAGFNLAHGAGNLILNLHQDNVDFAVWCSYKYLNSGPGGLAGCFIHERWHKDEKLPRFEGWWGHNKQTRFKMPPQFDPIVSAEAWQLSNPPIFQLASMRASMELFDRAQMSELRKKGDQLTAYMEFLIQENLAQDCIIMTPKAERGSMLSLRMKKDAKKLVNVFKERGVVCDFREPDILRMTPAPLYNSFQDVFDVVNVIKESLHE